MITINTVEKVLIWSFIEIIISQNQLFIRWKIILLGFLDNLVILNKIIGGGHGLL